MMNELIEVLRDGPVLNKALFVMATGMLGVFIVLVVFYFSILILEKTLRPKVNEDKKGAPEKKGIL